MEVAKSRKKVEIDPVALEQAVKEFKLGACQAIAAACDILNPFKIPPRLLQMRNKLTIPSEYLPLSVSEYNEEFLNEVFVDPDI